MEPFEAAIGSRSPGASIQPPFDVFFSYRSRDHFRVSSLARSLAEHAGLRTFLDRWYLVPGEPWLVALERALGSCRAAAICIGPGELGPWQQREMWLALDRQARDCDFRVIPVLLPGADPVLGFLSTNMWIDLRNGTSDAEFAALLAVALRGAQPLPEIAATFKRVRTSVCPYRGLLCFREEDAPFFLGREPIVDELQRVLADASMVSVVGASGSGKSSLVRAGLVPRLRRSQAPVWEVTTMVPGDRPLRALAAVFVLLLEPEMTEVQLLVETNALAAALSAGEVSVRDVAERVLARQPGTERVLLAVDQWEELYTLTHDSDERACFIGQLLEATSHAVLSVVLTLRGDFVGQVLADRRLADRLQGAQVNVGPMTTEELRCAIEEPARAAGLRFEPGLVDAILGDVDGEPGHLPLLEFVLRQLWDLRRDDVLHHDAYRAIGRLEGSIAHRAERVFESLSDAERVALRHLFMRLARPGDGHDYTRLRALSADISQEEWQLVRRLADERLLVTALSAIAPDQTVEVSHEALLRHWRRLRTWLDRDREFLLWRERLRPMIRAWTEGEEHNDSLLQGAFLVEAEKWRVERHADLSASEQRYIEGSVQVRSRREQEEHDRRDRELSQAKALADALQLAANQEKALAREAKEHAQQTEVHAAALRRRNLVLRSVMALLVVAGAFAAWQASSARREAAHVRRLFAQSYKEEGRRLVVEGHFQEAVPYLREAHRNDLDEPPLRMLFHSATRHLPLVPALAHQAIVVSAAFSRDGSRVVTASSDKTARVWDATTGKPLASPLEHQEKVWSAAFSPDSTRIVTASDDKTARVWDAATSLPLTGPLEHQEAVWSAAFSPDGTRVVTASRDKTARVWDSTTGKVLTPPLVHQDWVWSAAFSPDGTRIVTASDDKTARVWDAATGKPLTGPLEHQKAVWNATFSPDGTRVITASWDKTARVWDATTGKPLTAPLEHQAEVVSAAFSPDGTRVVTASGDKTARVWDATTGKPLTSPVEHQEKVTSAAFSPDGTRVITASDDKTARVWDATTGEPLTTPLEHQAVVLSAAFSPDGTRVVTTSDDKTARVWDAATGKPLTTPLEHQAVVVSAAFSPDGMRVVTASWDRTARVWDAATGKPLTTPLEHQAMLRSAVFSPNGTRVVTASEDKTARVWDAATGKPVTTPLEHQAEVVSATFSPDGTRVVTASEDKTARVWDAATGKLLTTPLEHQAMLRGAAFSPDGTRVVTASWDKTARVWDAATGKLLTSPLEHHAVV
jgi:WD40 repeat protein